MDNYDQQLRQIFDRVHRQHMPLKKAIEGVDGISRSTFYEIPEEHRNAIEDDVRREIEAEQEDFDQAVRRLRQERSIALQEKVYRAMESVVDRLVTVIQTPGNSDFNAIQAAKELRAMALEGIVEPEFRPSDKTPALPPPSGFPISLAPFPVGGARKIQVTAQNGATVTLEAPKPAEIVEG